MSEAPTTPEKSNKVGIPQGDVDFLMTCLRNTNGGSILINQAAVAEVLGLKNPRSVGNRLGALKKKYDLPFGTGTGASPAKTDKTPKAVKAPKTPETPSTPSGKPKGIVKKKATPRAKKAAVKKEEAPEPEVELKQEVYEHEDEHETDIDTEIESEEE